MAQPGGDGHAGHPGPAEGTRHTQEPPVPLLSPIPHAGQSRVPTSTGQPLTPPATTGDSG